jgi:hypothetical protein
VEWKPEYGLALLPIGAAIVASLLVVMVSNSIDAAQWAAIIVFFVTLPFVVSRLFDRAK